MLPESEKIQTLHVRSCFNCLPMLTLTVLEGNIIVFGLWNGIEPALGVVCACLPSMRPLFKWLLFQSSSIFDQRPSHLRRDTRTFTLKPTFGSGSFDEESAMNCVHPVVKDAAIMYGEYDKQLSRTEEAMIESKALRPLPPAAMQLPQNLQDSDYRPLQRLQAP